MNPFDAPPSTPAVSYEPPQGPKRNRAAMVGAAVVGAGLVGAAAFGVSNLVSADDPELATAPPTTVAGDEPMAPDETNGDETNGDGTELELDDGSVTIDTGDGEPWVIDLDELDADDVRKFQECIGLPALGDLDGDRGEFDGEFPMLDELFGDGEFPPLDELFGDGEFPPLDELFGEFDGEFPMLDELFGDGEFPMLDELFGEFEGEFDGELPALDELFGDGELPALDELLGEFDGEFPMLDDLVAVMGPDGPVIVDLGDDDASVTIERDGDTGEITVTTEGSATELQLDDLISDVVGAIDLPAVPDQIEPCLDLLDD